MVKPPRPRRGFQNGLACTGRIAQFHLSVKRREFGFYGHLKATSLATLGALLNWYQILNPIFLPIPSSDNQNYLRSPPLAINILILKGNCLT